MEKYGNDALVAEVDILRYDAGHSEGMLDEGMAVLPEFVLHRVVGYAVGSEYLLLLRIAGEDGAEGVFCCLYLAAAGKSRALAASSIFFLAASMASSSCLGLIFDITGSSATYRTFSSSSGSL